MHTNTIRVQTTFVNDFEFCLGGRAQHRILACMWKNHLNQMLQTEPCLSVVMNEITCMITILLRSIHILHKNPAKTQGMHFVSVKHWNIETHKLYRKINFWRITKSKTSPKGSIVSVVSKLWNALKMMKIAEHFSCFETNWNKPHFWCFETFLKRTETWQKLTNISVFLKRFETKLKQEENWPTSKCFSCFETFRNKIETSSGKDKNTRPHFWCFETLKQWII